LIEEHGEVFSDSIAKDRVESLMKSDIHVKNLDNLEIVDQIREVFSHNTGTVISIHSPHALARMFLQLSAGQKSM